MYCLWALCWKFLLLLCVAMFCVYILSLYSLIDLNAVYFTISTFVFWSYKHLGKGLFCGWAKMRQNMWLVVNNVAVKVPNARKRIYCYCYRQDDSQLHAQAVLLPVTQSHLINRTSGWEGPRTGEEVTDERKSRTQREYRSSGWYRLRFDRQTFHNSSTSDNHYSGTFSWRTKWVTNSCHIMMLLWMSEQTICCTISAHTAVTAYSKQSC